MSRPWRTNDLDPTDANEASAAFEDREAMFELLGVTSRKDALQAIQGLQERVKFTEHFESLVLVLKDYLDWGAMTGSDRDLHEDKFRAVLAKAEGRERAE